MQFIPVLKNRKILEEWMNERKQFDQYDMDLILYNLSYRKLVNKEILQYFVEMKANINSTFLNGNSCFHSLLGNKHHLRLEEIEFMIQKKAELNMRNNYEDTPLDMALQNKNINVEMVKYLIETNCQVERDSFKKIKKPNKKIEIIKQLQSLNINFLDEINQIRPTMNILIDKYITPQSLLYFIEKKLDVCNNFSLSTVCENKNVSLELLQILIQNKATINQKSVYGTYPLMALCNNKHVTLDM